MIELAAEPCFRLRRVEYGDSIARPQIDGYFEPCRLWTAIIRGVTSISGIQSFIGLIAFFGGKNLTLYVYGQVGRAQGNTL